MMRTTQATILVVFLSLGAVACSNPADNVPAAEVADVAAPAEETAAPAEAPAEPGRMFTLAEGSTVGFIGSKVTGSHEGGFNSITGEISLVGDNPAGSSVTLSIDTTSLWSDSEKLTGHLKSADFFDVEKYPTATFASTEIVASEDGYMVTGDLDLHGISRSITFPARIAMDGDTITAQAEFSILRFDFDIVYPGRTDDLIRDEVVVKFDIVMTPAMDENA
jgi:polyisoprenoid-binding protein YceI